MAFFKPMAGSSVNLPSQEKKDGCVWFCMDDGSIYVDLKDSNGEIQRKQMSSSIITKIEELQNIINNSPLVDNFQGFGVLDAGFILSTDNLDINIIDPGNII